MGATQALNFGASTDRVLVGSQAVYDNMAKFAVLAWVRPGTLAAGKMIVTKQSSSDANGWRCMIDGAGGHMNMRKTRVTTNMNYITNNRPLVAGEWRAVFFLFDFTGGSFQVWSGDAATPVAQHTYGTSANGSGSASTGAGSDAAQSMIIGNDSGNDTSFAGKIGPVTIMNDWPSQAQMDAWMRSTTSLDANGATVWTAALDNATTVNDVSSQNNDGTVTGATVVSGVLFPTLAGQATSELSTLDVADPLSMSASGQATATATLSLADDLTMSAAGQAAASCSLLPADALSLSALGQATATLSALDHPGSAEQLVPSAAGQAAASCSLLPADQISMSALGQAAASAFDVTSLDPYAIVSAQSGAKNALSGATASVDAFTPVLGRYYVFAVESRFTSTPSRPTNSVRHASFSALADLGTVTFGTIATPTRRLTLFGGLCDQSVVSDVMTFDFAAQSQTATIIRWRAFEWARWVQTATAASNSSATPSATLAGVAEEDAVFASIGFSTDGSTVTADLPFTDLGRTTSGSGNSMSLAALFWREATDTGADSPSWDIGTTVASGIVAIELARATVPKAAGQATVTLTLAVADPLVLSASGQAAASCSMLPVDQLSLSALGQATVTLELSGAGLQPSAAGQATVTLALSVKDPLTLAASGQAAASCSLLPVDQISLSALGQAATTASVTIADPLVLAQVSGQAAASCSLLPVDQISLSAAGQGTTTASLVVAVMVTLSIAGQAAASGSLLPADQISLSAIGQGAATATVTRRVPIAFDKLHIHPRHSVTWSITCRPKVQINATVPTILVLDQS